MDFLNLLLLYLSMTFAMGVQEAPAPGVAPEPTSLPVTVMAQQGVMPSAETDIPVTATPVPTQTPVPQPTLTPNASYGKLEYGMKGTQVKRLQERLIELGYLPAGAADGAYGSQTLNAVRDFQKANGLSADGVAGRATLTHLYENARAVYGKLAKTPTPAPATPAPGQTQAPYNPMDAWTGAGASQILLNGQSLAVVRTSGGVNTLNRPQVWLRNESELMLNLAELADAAGWPMKAERDGSGCTLTAAGREIVLLAQTNVSAGFCQVYAATVDGATPLRRLISITLPSIAPTIITMLILRVGGILSAGQDQVYAMYNELVYSVADILDTYALRVGLNNLKYSMSTAVSLFKSAIGLVMILVTNKISKMVDENNGIF